MTRSMLFLPLAVLGAALLVLGASAVLWVPLLVIGLAGTVGFGALGASHDDRLRAQATGVTESERGPRTPGRRTV